MFGAMFRVRVRFKVRIRVRVIVRVNYFRDYFSVLVRAQHRSPTSDHNSSRALTACLKNTCEIRAAAAAFVRPLARTLPLVCAGLKRSDRRCLIFAGKDNYISLTSSCDTGLVAPPRLACENNTAAI